MPQAQVALAWQSRRSERQTVHAPSSCSHCAKPGRLVLHGERAARLGTLIPFQQLCSLSTSTVTLPSQFPSVSEGEGECKACHRWRPWS